MRASLSMSQHRLDNAPSPSETTARKQSNACLAYINRINAASDTRMFPDDDPRPNFEWAVTELHENRLRIAVPHAEISKFTLRWPDADVEFVTVREPLPDDYYDGFSNPNLCHYTVFILDFTPYGTDDERSEDSPSDTWGPCELARLRTPASRSKHSYGV